MATVPAVPPFTDGILNSTTLGQLGDVVAFLKAPPIAELRQTSAQTISTGTFTAINFDTEDLDSADGHDAGLPSRYTAVYPGYYEVGGGVTFAANATGRRLARMHVNSALVSGSVSGLPGNASILGFALRAKKVFLNIGDYLEIFMFQDSGGNLATFITNTEYQPTVSIRWVSS